MHGGTGKEFRMGGKTNIESAPEVRSPRDEARDAKFPAFPKFLDFEGARRLSDEHARANTATDMKKFPDADELLKGMKSERRKPDHSTMPDSLVDRTDRPERKPHSGPAERQPERRPESESQPRHNVTRDIKDWNHFYRSQTRSNNCLPTSMSMMYADLVKHSPASDAELKHFEKITHVGQHGPYTGSAHDIARQAESQFKGLHTAVVEGVNRKTLGEQLDKHLKDGHTAIVGIKSPYSSGNHYIYVAGIDSHGKYIIGDSGRHGGGKLGKTIGREDLLNRMMDRGGGPRMVAGWTDQPRQHEPAKPLESTRTKDVIPPMEITGASDRREVRLKDAVVNIPKDLDPSKPIHFMTYFHGHRSGFADGHQAAKLNEQMKNAPPNTVLISPRWQDHEGSESSNMSEYQQKGGLNHVLQDVFKNVPELQRRTLSPNDKIGLVGFSAGYNPVAKALADKDIASHVDNIVMLDSPSSAVRDFVSSHLKDFANGTKHLSMVAGDWRAADYKGFEQNLNQKMRQQGIRENHGIHFTYTRTPHGEIPAKYFSQAAF
jgi:hypothetical protein